MKLTYPYKFYPLVKKIATIKDWSALVRRRYHKVVVKARCYLSSHCGQYLYYDACTLCCSQEGDRSSGASVLKHLLPSRRYWRCSRRALVQHQPNNYHKATIKVKKLIVVHPVKSAIAKRELKREPACASVKHLGRLRMSLDID